jgi:hypothetical protein
MPAIISYGRLPVPLGMIGYDVGALLATEASEKRRKDVHEHKFL